MIYMKVNVSILVDNFDNSCEVQEFFSVFKNKLKRKEVSFEVINLNDCDIKTNLNNLVNGETIVYMDMAYIPDLNIVDEVVECLSVSGRSVVTWSRLINGSKVKGWGVLGRLLARLLRVTCRVFAPQIKDCKDTFPPIFIADIKTLNFCVGNFRMWPLIYTVISREEVHIQERRGIFKIHGGKMLRRDLSKLFHVFGLARDTGEFNRMLKFAAVGVSGIFVNESILFALTEIFEVFYLASAAISVEMSILSNFMLNELWTFRDRRSKGFLRVLRRALKYNFVSFGALTINLVVLYFLVEFFGIHYLLANLIGIFVAFLWNFVLSTLWAWGGESQA